MYLSAPMNNNNNNNSNVYGVLYDTGPDRTRPEYEEFPRADDHHTPQRTRAPTSRLSRNAGRDGVCLLNFVIIKNIYKSRYYKKNTAWHVHETFVETRVTHTERFFYHRPPYVRFSAIYDTINWHNYEYLFMYGNVKYTAVNPLPPHPNTLFGFFNY